MLLDWIDPDKLDYNALAFNPHDGVIQLFSDAMKENPEKIDWCYLSKYGNNNTILFLRENPDKIDWYELSNNTNDGAIALLVNAMKENPDKIHWNQLCRNSNDGAIQLLRENPNKIHWQQLCINSNDGVVALLEAKQDNSLLSLRSCFVLHPFEKHRYEFFKNIKDDALSQLQKENPNTISWSYLSCNTNDGAVQLLSENQHKIDWCNLSYNTNDGAIALLRENPDKIDWYRLSRNPNDGAIQLLYKNPEKIDWVGLSLNPNDDAITLFLNKIECRSIFQKLYYNYFKNEENKYWRGLCGNQNKKVMDILEENQDKIDWFRLSENPAIFQDHSYVLK
jgi:ribosomal protein L24E